MFEEIEKKIAEDSAFQDSLKDLSEDDRKPLIEARKNEIIAQELEEAKKNRELANNYKTRAEKAEGEIKKYKPTEATPVVKNNEGNITPKDLYALIEAKVPQEDIEDVTEYAAFKKISVADALKSGVVKNMLAEKSEFRRTANATQTRQTRQTVKVDGHEIANTIKSKGEDAVPNKGSSDAEELFWARRGGRR